MALYYCIIRPPREFAVAYYPGEKKSFSSAEDTSDCFIVVADEAVLTPEITARLLPAVARYVGESGESAQKSSQS